MVAPDLGLARQSEEAQSQVATHEEPGSKRWYRGTGRAVDWLMDVQEIHEYVVAARLVAEFPESEFDDLVRIGVDVNSGEFEE